MTLVLRERTKGVASPVYAFKEEREKNTWFLDKTIVLELLTEKRMTDPK